MSESLGLPIKLLRNYLRLKTETLDLTNQTVYLLCFFRIGALFFFMNFCVGILLTLLNRLLLMHVFQVIGLERVVGGKKILLVICFLHGLLKKDNCIYVFSVVVVFDNLAGLDLTEFFKNLAELFIGFGFETLVLLGWTLALDSRLPIRVFFG